MMGRQRPDAPPGPKPYLSAREVAELTPWTVEAIDAMVRRGVLKERIHWFRPAGRRERIYKWAAVVDLIEGTGKESERPMVPQAADRIPLVNGGELIVPS